MMKSINEFNKKFKKHDYIGKIFADGHRTGYVKLNSEETFNKLKKAYSNYNDLIDCHGGVTFIEEVQNHPFLPDGNWVGFDCLHYGDKPDLETARKLFNDECKEILFFNDGELRTVKFVEKECKNIINQLIELGD